jgi:hypothetical protein
MQPETLRLQWFRHVDFFVPQSGDVARQSLVIALRLLSLSTG